jgi:hypothetical protein
MHSGDITPIAFCDIVSEFTMNGFVNVSQLNRATKRHNLKCFDDGVSTQSGRANISRIILTNSNNDSQTIEPFVPQMYRSLVSESNGTIYNVVTNRPLVIPPPIQTTTQPCTQGIDYINTTFAGVNPVYRPFQMKMGSVVNFYYWNGQWVMSTAKY